MPSWISTGMSSQPQAQNKIVLFAKLTMTLIVTDAVSIGKPESHSWKHSGIFMITNAPYHILSSFQIISVCSDHCGILSEYQDMAFIVSYYNLTPTYFCISFLSFRYSIESLCPDQKKYFHCLLKLCDSPPYLWHNSLLRVFIFTLFWGFLCSIR